MTEGKKFSFHRERLGRILEINVCIRQRWILLLNIGILVPRLSMHSQLVDRYRCPLICIDLSKNSKTSARNCRVLQDSLLIPAQVESLLHFCFCYSSSCFLSANSKLCFAFQIPWRMRKLKKKNSQKVETWTKEKSTQAFKITCYVFEVTPLYKYLVTEVWLTSSSGKLAYIWKLEFNLLVTLSSKVPQCRLSSLPRRVVSPCANYFIEF